MSNNRGSDRTYSRRTFLAAATAMAAADAARANGEPIPIIDTHLHLYDPTRPQGVPIRKLRIRLRRCRLSYREDVDSSRHYRRHRGRSEPLGRGQSVGAGDHQK